MLCSTPGSLSRPSSCRSARLCPFSVPATCRVARQTFFSKESCYQPARLPLNPEKPPVVQHDSGSFTLNLTGVLHDSGFFILDLAKCCTTAVFFPPHLVKMPHDGLTFNVGKLSCGMSVKIGNFLKRPTLLLTIFYRKRSNNSNIFPYIPGPGKVV